jgi:hypothetical protein
MIENDKTIKRLRKLQIAFRETEAYNKSPLVVSDKLMDSPFV